MRLALLLVAPVALLPLLAALPAPATPPAQACANDIDHEPVMFYGVHGFGFAGLINRQLAVYDDGFALYATVNGPFGQTVGDAGSTNVTKADIDQLKLNLRNAGAFQLCDEPSFAQDVPTSTVTVFTGETDARAHTFSYLIPLSAETQAVSQIVSDFQNTHFPGF